MALILKEEQQLLKDTAEGFFTEHGPVSMLRELRNKNDPKGYCSDLWGQMAEMGFAGIIMPEELGGAGFGWVGAGLVAEAMGRHLTPSPFLSSSVVAASILLECKEHDQAQSLLADIAAGRLTATAAVDEKSHHSLNVTQTKLTKAGAGYQLSGFKTFVPDGHTADWLIVSAKSDAGLCLCLAPQESSGVIVDRVISADSRNWAKVSFEQVSINKDAVFAEGRAAEKVLARALAKSRVVVAAELLGIARQAFDMTIEYLKERKQFGVNVGSFQSLQHRAAHMFSEIEAARSSVLKALQIADTDNNASLDWFSSLAKAKACKTVELVTNEAIQMHGGIGMTDEYDIGFYIKRARVMQHYLGDYNFHLDQFAKASGY